VTETRLSGLLIKTGSIPTDAIENFSGNVTASLPTGTVSSSTQVTALLPGGAISSSTQVNYTQLQNIPSGIASSSAQVTAYLPSGVASSSAQIKEYLPSDTVSGSIQIKAFLPDGTVSSSTQLPDGIASSSAQIKSYLPTGTVSSSGQVSYLGLSNIPSGIASGSAQVKAYLPTDTVSSSAQVTSFLPTGTVSSSGQVSYLGLSNIPSGIASSSAQVTAYLPTGTVSQSSQIIVQNTTGIGALATTGSNTFAGSQTITGNLTVNQNFTVLGSASIQYVSQSTLNIGTNLITVNTDTPAVTLGGLAVIDSGSSPQRSGSLLFDSVNDQWIFVHQNTAGGVTSSVLVMGPPTFNNVGSETLLTQNRLVKGNGLEHVVSSIITDDGTNVGIGSASPSTKLDVSGNTKTSAVLLPGSTSGTVTLQAAATAGTTTITLPATTGTVVTTGDSGTVTNTMLAGSIANNKLANSTISGISLGSNLATLTIGSGLTGTSYNGSTAVTISISSGAITNAMLANSTISGVALGSNLATLTLGVSGTGLSGTATYNGSGAATFTVTSNATSANTTSAIVARDASGNFSAGTITAALSGNASTATTWQTGRTITIGSTGKTVDGSGNVSWTLSEIGAYSNTNPSGYTTNTGTVTSVTVSAGTGMSGGGTVTTSGTITLTNAGVTSNVAGTGITVSGATGAVTITNSGVTSIVAGTGISISGGTGAVTVTNGGVTSVNGSTGAVTVAATNQTMHIGTTAVAINRGSGALSLTGVSIDGSAGNASTVGGITVAQIFNNLGNNHSTYTDFNNVPGFGPYYVQGNGNGPGSSGNQYYGFTLGLGNEYAYSSYASQFYWHRTPTGGNPYVYVRFREGGTWGSWSKIYAGYADSAGSITSQANSATITADTAASANTIVRRDGSGHITGAYIFGSYFNASAGNSENPTIGQIWTQNTSDNYLRKSTPAHLISQLGLITTSNYSSYAIPISGGINMSGGFGLNDQRLYLRTNGDTNHYIWNAADDWEELVFYTGTGFRIAGSNGSSYATVTTNGIACGTITSTYYNSGDGLFLFRYGSNSGVTRHINLSNSTTDPSAASVDSGISWGQRSDNQAYYLVYCTQENYNGNYNKLTLNWHTGIRIGAATTYGGTTFYDNSLNITSTILFSVGRGDSNVRTSNTFYAGGDVVAYSSDIRLKENIKPIDNAIDKIMKLNGVYYTWKDMVTDVGFTPLQKDEVGVLAQEVQEVLPEVVTAAPFDCEIDPPTGKTQSKSGQNYLTVKYEKLVPLLIEAIKEQQTTIQQLNSRIDALESK